MTKPVCHLHDVPLKIHIAIIILTKLVYVNEGWCSITLDMACLFRAQMSMVIHYLPGASVLQHRAAEASLLRQLLVTADI